MKDGLASRRDRALAAAAGSAILARLAAIVGSLVCFALAARALQPSELGVVAVLSALVTYFGFGDFGFGSLLMTRLPVALVNDDTEEMRDLVSAATSGLLAIAAVVGTAGLASLFAVPWPALLGATHLASEDVYLTVATFFALGTLGIIGTVGTRTLAALQEGAFVRSTIAGASLVSVVLVYLCTFTDAPLPFYLSAFAGPTSLVGFLHLDWVRRRYPSLRFGLGHLSLARAWNLMRAGTQYAIMSTGWVLTYTLDALVVSAILGSAQAAVFAVAARLFGLVSTTLATAGQQLWPAIAEALARGDLTWVRKRFVQSVGLVALISFGGSAILCIVGQPVSRIWMGPEYVPPVRLLVAFALWTFFISVMTQYSYLLLSQERIRALAWLSLLLAPVNLGSSIVLTKWIGITGPIVGSLMAAVVVQLVPTILLTRKLTSELSAETGEWSSSVV